MSRALPSIADGARLVCAARRRNYFRLRGKDALRREIAAEHTPTRSDGPFQTNKFLLTDRDNSFFHQNRKYIHLYSPKW